MSSALEKNLVGKIEIVKALIFRLYDAITQYPGSKSGTCYRYCKVANPNFKFVLFSDIYSRFISIIIMIIHVILTKC